MRRMTGTAIVLGAFLLAWLPSSATATTFVQSPGSPYSTTNPPFHPNSGGFLGGAVSGDFTGNGISDIAVVNETGLPVFSAGESVTVMLGNRDGELTMAPGSPVEVYSGGISSSPGAIAAGDFNGDGKLDLAVVDETNNTVTILLGDGNGRFHSSGAPIPYSGSGEASIAVGDFSGDGNQDIVVVNDEVTVLLGNGAGGFTSAPGAPLTLSGYPTSVVTGDFNGDGRSDIAIANLSGYVTVYLSTGEGGFQAAPGSPPITGLRPRAIATADLTGNGKLDLVTANSGSDNVTVLLGNGSGGFTPATGSPFPVPVNQEGNDSCQFGTPESIAIGDFNGDGKPDLAVANFNGCSDNVAILQGDGSGQFTNAAGSPFNANGNPRGMVTGDFNGDGKPDLTVVNPFLGAVTVLLNTTSEWPSSPPGSIVSTPPNGGEVWSNPPTHPPAAPRAHHGRKKGCQRAVGRRRRGQRRMIHAKKCRVRGTEHRRHKPRIRRSRKVDR